MEGSPRQEPARGLPQAQAGLRIQQELGWRCPSQHDTPGRCAQWCSRTCAGRGAWGGEEQGQRPGTPRLGSWWLRSHPRGRRSTAQGGSPGELSRQASLSLRFHSPSTSSDRAEPPCAGDRGGVAAKAALLCGHLACNVCRKSHSTGSFLVASQLSWRGMVSNIPPMKAHGSEIASKRA